MTWGIHTKLRQRARIVSRRVRTIKSSLRPRLITFDGEAAGVGVSSTSQWPIRRGALQVCGLRRGGTNSLDVANRRFAEQPFVFTSEVGSVLVPDAEAGAGGVEVVRNHQPPRLLKADVLLELQRLMAVTALNCA